eukprot:TRINITY_DN4306_c0_g1_i2.p2 TRINITY_DN4306_c0_g1~~TRINITY_DN4306_c0_g1_i2.p2  ORF type:complete len:126 (-),score=15.89 TRINITY_DN4306_c0_g1_i2:58-435(-)
MGWRVDQKFFRGNAFKKPFAPTCWSPLEMCPCRSIGSIILSRRVQACLLARLFFGGLLACHELPSTNIIRILKDFFSAHRESEAWGGGLTRNSFAEARSRSLLHRRACLLLRCALVIAAVHRSIA